MKDILKDKKAIFFDVGYTLDHPASGDWMLTNRFYQLAGGRCGAHSAGEIQRAKDKSAEYLVNNHLLTGTDEEYRQFVHFYGELSGLLELGLSQAEIDDIAYDRTYNMANYVLYPHAAETLETLGRTHRLGIISDTWPSIEPQLEYLGVRRFFSTTTYSCSLGVFKPDKRMYADALGKMGLPAGDTVFIDDMPQNLAGAAGMGITPILIAANPVSDVDVAFTKIHSLDELLED